MVERTSRSPVAAGRIAVAGLTEAQVFQVLTGLALGLGILVRALEVLRASFPLNDGGMFFVMVRDLQANGYRLPETTSYNAADIPFAYPPLAFYVAALLDDLTAIGLIELFRFLPMLFTCLTVVAFYALARDLLRSRLALLAAVTAFALLPRSFIWLVMGGGLTRSLGFLLAIVALHQAYRMYRTGSSRAAVFATLAAAGTVLSHLETGWFLAFSMAIFFIAFGRDRRGVWTSSAVVAGVVVLTAPWWLAVVAMHGIAPFTAADGSGTTIFSGAETRRTILLALARGGSTAEPYFPVIATLGLLGGLICLFTRRLLLPLWWLAIVMLDFRAYATFGAVPIALMAGVAVTELIWPAIARHWRPHPAYDFAFAPATEISPPPVRSRVPHWAPAALALGAMAYFCVFALVFTSRFASERWVLTTLRLRDREAMEWVRLNTPEDSSFVVVPRASWEADKATEWFPAIAGRKSLTTVQGTEWLPGEFRATIASHNAAWNCAQGTSGCLEGWATLTGAEFTHVWLPSGCCTTLEASLSGSRRYEMVYADAGGVIFARTDAPFATRPIP